MLFFNKRIIPKKLVNQITIDISGYAAHGSTLYKTTITEEMEDMDFLRNTIEFAFFLIHIIDKLASKSYDDTQRNIIINEIIDNVKKDISQIKAFNSIVPKVVLEKYFEEKFKEVFYSYPAQSPIIGEGDTSVSYFAMRLIELFWKNKNEGERIFVQIIVNKMLENYLYQFLNFTSIKEFLKSTS